MASLVPGPLPDFISPPSRKIGSPQLQDKSGSGLGMRLATNYTPDEEMMKTLQALLENKPS